jgi:hypothetical protein
MQSAIFTFSKRLGAAALTLAGLIAAATAHADSSKDLVAATAALRVSPRQCTDVDAILAKLRFPTGTTFLLTDAGLIVINQPKAAKYPEPEPWPNSGG